MPRLPTRSLAINGGQRLAEEIFGSSILWLPYVDPGFTLAQTLKQALAEHRQRNGQADVRAILMANHGLIVAGDSPDEIRATTDELLGKIADRLGDDWADHVVRPADR